MTSSARVLPLPFSGEMNASRGVVNQVSDVKLEQGDLAEAWREGNVDYATVAMRFRLVDRTLYRLRSTPVGIFVDRYELRIG